MPPSIGWFFAFLLGTIVVMDEKQYIHLPKTGEHYQPPLGKLCQCKGCFRTIPNQEEQCVPCQQGYHGPGGLHGYGGDQDG